MKTKSPFRKGDSVIVKPDIHDPDLGMGIGGWRGIISEVDDAEQLVCVDWDSQTLAAMPGAVIDRCAEQGLGWDQMYLEFGDVQAAPRRDTPAQRAQTLARLHAEHQWGHLGAQGARIQAVIGTVDPDDERAIYKAWETHLRQVLRFPFEAIIAESQDRGPLHQGDRMTVQAITDIDDLRGLIVACTHQRSRTHFPLCDLEVLDHRSPNHDPVQIYVVWFANR
jgi:hypothetical protein